MWRLRHVADLVLGKLGYMRAQEHLLREGRVFVDVKDAQGHVTQRLDLGSNTLSDPFRVIVAKLLARKSTQVPPGATFPLGIDGYDHADPVFPVRLYIGTGSTATSPSDTSLTYYLTAEDTPTGEPLYYDLSRVMVRNTKAEYDGVGQPINVAFEFDIPVGTLRSGLNAEVVPYTLREFAIVASDGVDHPVLGPSDGSAQTPQASPSTQLARKVVTVLKAFELSLTVRWEIRT